MKIVLVCNAGMSTGIMRNKLEEDAQARGIEATVTAIPMVEVEEFLDKMDVVLLGPQIRFAANDIEKLVPENVPVLVISAPDFGMMNAKKIMDMILERLQA